MKIQVRKYPELFLNRKQIIWDSRQPQSQGEELVLVFADKYQETKIQNELLARKDAHFIGPPSQKLEHSTPQPRKWLGCAASQALGHPSSKLKVLTVTGTNGKTTSTAMLRHLLVESGWTVAELGTLGLRIWKPGTMTPALDIETGFTTAEAPTLHDLFAQFVQAGVDAVVMETSSHATELERIAGVDFDGALFTNLSQDHLDFHGSLEDYFEAKVRLFTDFLPNPESSTEEAPFLITPLPSTKRKFAVVHRSDSFGEQLLERIPDSLLRVGYKNTEDFAILSSSLSGSRVKLYPEACEFFLPLVGAFNVENAVGALRMAQLATERPVEELAAFFANFRGAKGRMERVGSKEPFIYVDYSHTPDALEKALLTLVSAKDSAAKIWVVFGCGGDRDRAKRPLMGKIAAHLADHVVICSDNPRSENPEKILDEIESGVPQKYKLKLTRLEKRREAIQFAVAQMASRDSCLIAGKGHEEYQIIGNKKIPFSDFEVALEALKARGPRTP